MTVLLEARRLSAGYGKVSAIQDIDLTVGTGEIVALLGPNGAGKTTTILALAGELRPTDGEVIWKGRTTNAPLHRRVRDGLALVPEEKSVFMGMSVLDNLRVGRGDPGRAFDLFPELVAHSSRAAGLLSGGQQQMLSLGRALAAQPEILLADELSLGLSPVAVDRLLTAVRAVSDEGTSVLIVEQQIHRALSLAQRAYVLRRGRIFLSGLAEDLLRNEDEVIEAYL